MFFVILFACTIFVEGLPPYIEAEAKFESSTNFFKVSGRIIFGERHDGTNSVHVNLRGGSPNRFTTYTTSIRKNPCHSKNTDVVNGIGSVIATLENKNYTDVAGIDLRTATGIVGRSFVLKDGTSEICSDILWKGPKLLKTNTTLSYGGIYGTIIMIFPQLAVPPTQIEVQNKASEYPMILSFGFYYGNETYDTLQSTPDHDWHLHAKHVDNNGIADCIISSEIIGKVSDSTLCSQTNPGKCAMGNMGDKFGHINVPGDYVFTDPNLRFIDVNGQNFVIHQANSGYDREACQILDTTQSLVKNADWRSPPSSPSSGGQAGMIAGAVIGALFGSIILCVLVYCIVKNIDCTPRPKKQLSGTSSMGMAQVQNPQNTEYQPDAQSPTKGAVLEDGKWRAVS